MRCDFQKNLHLLWTTGHPSPVCLWLLTCFFWLDRFDHWLLAKSSFIDRWSNFSSSTLYKDKHQTFLFSHHTIASYFFSCPLTKGLPSSTLVANDAHCNLDQGRNRRPFVILSLLITSDRPAPAVELTRLFTMADISDERSMPCALLALYSPMGYSVCANSLMGQMIPFHTSMVIDTVW